MFTTLTIEGPTTHCIIVRLKMIATSSEYLHAGLTGTAELQDASCQRVD